MSGAKGALLGAGLGAITNWAMDRWHIFGAGTEHQNSNVAALRGQEAELARTHIQNMNLVPIPDHLTNL